MPRCALVVDFRLTPGGWTAFEPVMTEHARLTRQEEPGCRQFDVLHDDDDADHVILIEVYDDLAAYEAHRANPRMPGVNAAIAPLTAQRTRTIGALS